MDCYRAMDLQYQYQCSGISCMDTFQVSYKTKKLILHTIQHTKSIALSDSCSLQVCTKRKMFSCAFSGL